jgi:MFS transporter, DHA1 family, multidrug resistance protein
MTHIFLPAIWLIVLIEGLPQLSETIYTPSLPDIARTLRASESMVEYTLTAYLCGFSIGTLFWGKMSDRLGRKPCVIAGLIIFIIGCIGGYLSTSITLLMPSRFVQAFGASIGSVLGQAICRDCFQGPNLGRVYSFAGSAVALFPAVGPVIGGLLSENLNWPSIFLFLMCFAVILTTLVSVKLPETHRLDNDHPISLVDTAYRLAMDQKVIGLGLIISACHGISFSYFAEGSFYLINGLGLSPSQYGLTFVAIATAGMMDGLFAKKLSSSQPPQRMMNYGLIIIFISAALFTIAALINHSLVPLSKNWMIATTVITQMTQMFGISMTTSNALALALLDYQWCLGTASSVFGFFYYGLISLFTLGMGLLHNGTLLPMPLYFFCLACFMILIQRIMIQRNQPSPPSF